MMGSIIVEAQNQPYETLESTQGNYKVTQIHLVTDEGGLLTVILLFLSIFISPSFNKNIYKTIIRSLHHI